MALLNICQSIVTKVISNRPTVALSSSDPKVQQAIEYINEAGQELAARYTWQVLTNEKTFNTIAAESQGTILSLTDPNFAFILNNIMWNRSQRRPVFGPRSPGEWQNLKATFMQGPWVQFRIRQNQLLFIPAPAAGQQIAFEWISKGWVSNAAGSVFAPSFAADDDVSLLDERVLALDALWRFKRANKLSYDEDYDKAEDAIKDLICRDGTKATLYLGGTTMDIWPGTVVPAGNWTL